MKTGDKKPPPERRKAGDDEDSVAAAEDERLARQRAVLQELNLLAEIWIRRLAERPAKRTLH